MLGSSNTYKRTTFAQTFGSETKGGLEKNLKMGGALTKGGSSL